MFYNGYVYGVVAQISPKYQTSKKLNTMEQSKKQSETNPYTTHGAMWRCFSDEYPEPYRNIIIDVNGEILETRTYLHQHKLMIKFRDGNEFFQGMSPKLLDQSTKWCYNAT